MASRLAGLIAVCVMLLAHSASAQTPTTTCALGDRIEQEDQVVFARFNRDYLMFMRIDDEPREFMLNITTPGAGIGDPFPINVCGADVTITLPDGSTVGGVMTYTKPDLTEELRAWPFKVAFINRADMRMEFDATFDGQIRGYIQFSNTEGYFVGDDAWRWAE